MIRPAKTADRQGVLALIPQLRSFGDVPCRAAEALDAGETRTVNRFFDTPSQRAALWVAEDEHGIIGAAYAEEVTDYFTQEAHAHLGILVVAPAASGRGIGRALVQTVERWARQRKHRFLTLNVFAGNAAARVFYDRAGFETDILRLIKPIDVAAR
jgi:GNAT superfamily N-acetyltransferase